MEQRIVVTQDLTETFRLAKDLRNEFIQQNAAALRPALELLASLPAEKSFHNLDP